MSISEHVIILCDLRALLLVVCLVTPALWLNLSDSRNILIIHFGLLLKERTLDSIGHDLWKKYNVICLLWMIRYIYLLLFMYLYIYICLCFLCIVICMHIFHSAHIF